MQQLKIDAKMYWISRSERLEDLRNHNENLTRRNVIQVMKISYRFT